METSSTDPLRPMPTASRTGTPVCVGAAVLLLIAIIFTILAFTCVHTMLGIIMVVCLFSQLLALQLGRSVLAKSQGPPEMITVGEYIREGSESYVKQMFGTILKFLLVIALLIFVCQIVQDSFTKALMIAISFIFGALCSGAAGIIGMWSSTRANARVAYTACVETYRNTIVIALRSGAVAGLTVVSLAVLGISMLLTLASLIEHEVSKVPLMLVGYGFGASFVALFCQLGGGIFTKAADVGADLTGKLELGIPEDDPRNPAVIADLVGDNVGDCCARGADLFESLSAEVIAAMILGATLTKNSKLGEGSQMLYILFPLAVHVFDLIVSFVGVMCVRPSNQPETTYGNPMTVLKQGYIVAVVLASLAFVGSSKVLLDIESIPHAWWHFLLCGGVGIASGFAVVFITQYYTDFSYGPVKEIAQASESGHATNIIAGLGVGMESTFPSMLVVCSGILTAYYLGYYAGFEGTDNQDAAGLYGTAVATMGMLSNLTYVLAMDVFGPITDNAAGIVEMSEQPAQARDIMDSLDAAGNTTKAMTKGFAVGSAGLACFLLFRAFIDVVHEHNSTEVIKADISTPQVFIAGIMGASTVYLFSAMSMKAVGKTAQLVVEEVRRQFAQRNIRTGEEKPEYGRCVDIVTQASIRQMVRPGLLVILMPCIIGSIFRVVGYTVDDPLLGAKAMLGFLVCASMSAMLMALFLNNGGGAWDNAKKFIERGNHGGKGSDAHKAAVTGDTVGDPSKDTAGPSLHVLMKLVATVTMVVGPIVAIPRG